MCRGLVDVSMCQAKLSWPTRRKAHPEGYIIPFPRHKEAICKQASLETQLKEKCAAIFQCYNCHFWLNEFRKPKTARKETSAGDFTSQAKQSLLSNRTRHCVPAAFTKKRDTTSIQQRCLQYLLVTLSHVNKKSQRMTQYTVEENFANRISTDAR